MNMNPTASSLSVLRPGTPVDRTANSNARSIRGNAVASYEFYNVLPAGTLKANQSYTIHLQGEDKNGNPIGKMAETLSVVAY